MEPTMSTVTTTVGVRPTETDSQQLHKQRQTCLVLSLRCVVSYQGAKFEKYLALKS
jgi:hypothetical protein